MARLIVEEGGEQRAFRLGNGLVTIGSGEGARLKLTSPDVAEVHAELEISGDAIRLRPRPGVAPPLVGGAPVARETTVQYGQTVQVGGALLRVEREEAALVEEPMAAPAPPSRRPKAQATATTGSRRRTVAKPRTIQKRKSVVERTPRQREQGVPTWFAVVGILAGLGLVLLLLWRGFASSAVADIDDAYQLGMARSALERGEFAKFEHHLELVTSTQDLSPADQKLHAQLVARAEELRNDNENRQRWDDGREYKRQYLEEYEQKHFQGNVDEAQIPLFLKRCRTFRERWPDHPELDWVQRQEARWSAVVSLDDLPTWAAVSWETYNLTTRGSSHDYRQAFRVMDEYEPIASPEEKAELLEKRAELVAERDEFFWNEMQLAKRDFEKGEVTRSVQKLVGLVQKIGDPELEDRAAGDLVLVFGDPRAEGMLAGYKERYPWAYGLLVRNSTLKAYARQQGLE